VPDDPAGPGNPALTTIALSTSLGGAITSTLIDGFGFTITMSGILVSYFWGYCDCSLQYS
jgi:hypothetical protein